RHAAHSPANPRQATALAALTEPEAQRQAWDLAQEKAGASGKMTTQIVEEAVKEVKQERAAVAAHRPTIADRTQFIPLEKFAFAGVTPLKAYLANPPKPSFNRTNDNVEW